MLTLAMHTVGAVVRETMVLAAGLAIIRLCGLAVFRLIAPLLRLHAPRILEDLVVIVGYVAWGLVRLHVAGLDLSGIVATSAVITAIIAFSMQETLGNILGGLALEFDSAFEIGDWIRVDEVCGQVVDIRWRSISIETNDWETVVIPNSHLVRSRLTIVGRRQNEPSQWRRWVRFDVDLGTPPEQVSKAVEEALRSAMLEHVSQRPAPDCILTGLDSGFARYAVRYFLSNPARDDAVSSAVRDHTLKALQRAGIRISVPEQNIHLTTEDEKHRSEVKQRELARRLAALKTVDLLTAFSEEELQTIAERLTYAPFAPGAVITRQGAIAHWLYILTGGEVDIILEAPQSPAAMRGEPAHAAAHAPVVSQPHTPSAAEPLDKQAGLQRRGQRHLRTLTAPNVFGEMGLMLGIPRSTTVIARTAVECYRLDKSAFEGILLAREGLLENISRVLASRQMDLARAEQAWDAQTRAQGALRHDEILGQIKRFFGILAK
jgi:small-conductance mechanosensitive channel